ncbi:MAG: PH domain-containing protein [Microbacterium sp.]|uniref:PH domain-containing protein n=1 Tax=Microbacterium sp. TaxID=51671 RepID=UPI00262196D3|nr:PH domain-containing protein [Microbacterium sp.]MCX6500843.1 PH domain-containing protein [Microbacterium sp.]
MTAPQPALVRSPLSDGQWHRPHPLTPLLRGGLALLVVIGVIVANLRERLVAVVLPWFAPEIGDDYSDWEEPGDPIDWVVANNLYLVVALAVLGALVLLVVGFALAWRFHTFRITGDDVEVRSGILFRSHRRAPLDRVQGVNLTRPFVARLLGLAKLEVVGAGASGNVRLEYLRVRDAETIRADILRLASGLRLSEGMDAEPAASPAAARLRETVARGINGIVEGDEPAGEPASVVVLPVTRLVLSRLLDTTTVVVVLIAVAAGIIATVGPPWVLLAAVPAVLGMGAYQVRQLVRSLRYSIAPTPDGVRITFGLLTTVTEIVPPGRIHAVEITQPLLWRPAGWWTVRINRVNGRSSGDTSTDQLTTVLPVGTVEDVERVLALVLPGLEPAERRKIVAAGTASRGGSDAVTTMPRRAWFLRPLSWWRNGYLRTAGALVLRRGVVWRKLAILPYARLQSIALHQGPLARAVGVAGVHAHTVSGPVYASLAGVDRDGALALWDDVARAAVVAASADTSHRWASDGRGHDIPPEPIQPASASASTSASASASEENA